MSRKNALITTLAFIGLSLFGGFVHGTPELEQLCQCLIIFAFFLYADKNSYQSLILQGVLFGAFIELLDERYRLNNGKLLLGDYTFTSIWIAVTIARCYIRYKQTKR